MPSRDPVPRRPLRHKEVCGEIWLLLVRSLRAPLFAAGVPAFLQLFPAWAEWPNGPGLQLNRSKQQNGGALLVRGDAARLPLGKRSQARSQQSELIGRLPTLTFCPLRGCTPAHHRGEHLPPSCSEFQKDVMDVLLDRPIAQVQFATNLFVR